MIHCECWLLKVQLTAWPLDTAGVTSEFCGDWLPDASMSIASVAVRAWIAVDLGSRPIAIEAICARHPHRACHDGMADCALRERVRPDLPLCRRLARFLRRVERHLCPHRGQCFARSGPAVCKGAKAWYGVARSAKSPAPLRQAQRGHLCGSQRSRHCVACVQQSC